MTSSTLSKVKGYPVTRSVNFAGLAYIFTFVNPSRQNPISVKNGHTWGKWMRELACIKNDQTWGIWTRLLDAKRFLSGKPNPLSTLNKEFTKYTTLLTLGLRRQKEINYTLGLFQFQSLPKREWIHILSFICENQNWF